MNLPPSILNWLMALRPHHWIKNGFCVAALVFSGQMTQWKSWQALIPVVLGFCALSSAAYLLNDILNIKEDRRHPRKQKRPLAAGMIQSIHALVVSVLLAGSALAALYAIYGTQAGLSRFTFLICALYVVQTVLYSLFLRKVAILDVLTLSSGFLLRVAAGAFALNLAPTVWILAATYGVAAMLGFGKRLGEFHVMESNEQEIGETRSSLQFYRKRGLELLVSVTSLFSLVSYVSYVIFHRESLFMLLSAVPVVFGLSAYTRMAWRSAQVESPEYLLLRQPSIQIAVLLWIMFITAEAFSKMA